jgi:glycosyltransferase involved in cell wall biosynthesis
MAAGTPWVAFDVGCVASYPGGIVARSSAEMLDATKTLLADREYQRYLGALGKDHVTRHHDWDTIISRYETLFAQLQGAARA